MINKATVKDWLGELPLTAEVYWQFRQKKRPLTKSFSLRRVEKHLPEWCAQVQSAVQRSQAAASPKSRIMLFSTLRYWIEHASLLGLTLAGLGHRVTFAYSPYPNWRRDYSRFDIRRHNAYARSVIRQAAPYLDCLSLIDVKPVAPQAMPEALRIAIQEVSIRDTQYTLQIEAVDCEGSRTPSAHLYQLRLERNMQAAGAMLAWFNSLEPNQRPEVLMTPNGSILEMGAVYQAARFLGIPAVTYEFGEQRGRIWLANNSEVMLQETDALWAAHKDAPLTAEQLAQIRDLYASRQNASLWKNFARLWQESPSQGGEQVRQAMGLDSRPVVLLAANVIGDSLTLGRQIFSQNMTDWLEHTAQFFAQRQDVQLVVRIHPGERYISGPSVAQVVRHALPEIPSHIHLVEAADPINTYDLVEIADLGLVYTTTVGMEMAMSGVPVIVAGKTHYRGKGFTLDPDSWEAFHQILGQRLSAQPIPRLARQQTELAWNYAYRFFFDFPCPFPWHLLDLWDQLETWPLERVLSSEGQALFGDTFRYLCGETRNWATQAV
jgi:hypothetical protein